MIALRRRCAASFGAMAFTAALFARLGDAPEDAARRYGAGRDHAATAPADRAIAYAHAPFTIDAELIAGRIHRIRYRKEANFTDEEIAQLLADNAGDQVWVPEKSRLNPIADRAGLKSWLRSDRGSAVMQTDASGAQVFVFTDLVFLRANLEALASAPPAPPNPAMPVATTTAPPAAGRGPIAAVTGKILLGLGVLASALAFLHDIGRLRAGRVHPQFAPKRIAPEVHFLAAIFAGVGVGLAWDWWLGLAWFAGYLVAAYLLIARLIARIFD